MRSVPTASAALLLLLPLAAPPAAALTAEELQADIAQFLEEVQLDLAPATLAHGEPAIVEDGAGFRVTIPALAVEGIDSDHSLQVGDVSFLVAESLPGSYDFSEVTLSERLEVLGAAGEALGSVTFDLERLSGTLASDLGELTRLDFALSRLDLRVPAEGFVFWVGRSEARLDTRPSADGYHVQEQDYRIGDIVIADGEGTLEIAEGRLQARMAGLDLEAYRTLLAIMADVETAAARGDASKLDALRATMAELAARDPVATEVEQSFELTGLTGHGERGQPLGSLERLSMEFTADAVRGSDEGNAGFVFSGEGLALDPVGLPDAAPWLGLVPQRWSMPLRLERLPMQALSTAIVDLVFALSLDPLSAEGQADIAGQAILDALGAAGSRLVVEDFFIDSPLLRSTLASALVFDPETPLGLVGTTAVSFFGLDKVLSFAETLADEEAKRYLKMAVLGLMGFGQATAEPDGSVGYKFEFFFAPDGNVTMNGFGMGDWMNKAFPQ